MVFSGHLSTTSFLKKQTNKPDTTGCATVAFVPRFAQSGVFFCIVFFAWVISDSVLRATQVMRGARQLKELRLASSSVCTSYADTQRVFS